MGIYYIVIMQSAALPGNIAQNKIIAIAKQRTWRKKPNFQGLQISKYDKHYAYIRRTNYSQNDYIHICVSKQNKNKVYI